MVSRQQVNHRIVIVAIVSVFRHSIFCVLITCVHVFFFFFFQAEDGIRDSSVTGVQTCALPISMNEGARIYAPGGVLLETGNRLEQPGLVRALELMAEEGAASAYSGSIADALLALMLQPGGPLTGQALQTSRPRLRPPAHATHLT